jgi:transposase
VTTEENTPKQTAKEKKRYPSDVDDAEWEFVVPYLALITAEAPQRKHDLREVFNALRYVVRTGIAWRYLPIHFPPWAAVYQQTQRWIEAGCFESIVHDLRELLRIAAGKNPQPTTALYDGQTLQGTVESGNRAGYDGHKKKTGSKVHAAVDSLGHLMALVVTPANEQERHQVEELSRQVQKVTGKSVKLAWVDQGYTGPEAAAAASKHGIELEVVKLPEAKKGFVLLPHRWVVERSFSWKSRFRRLVRDYERLPETVAGLHYLAFACLMMASLLGTTLWSA